MNWKVIGGYFLDFLFNDIVTHLPIYKLRIGFLRIFNKRISSKATILMHTRLLHFWNVVIGPNVVINQYCLLDCRRHTITILNDTDIGPYTKVWTLGHDPNSYNHQVCGGDVFIGHHVWIAAGVTILPNIIIADGSVVGAGSVVHNHTNGLDIVAGNPARFIKKRINKLEYNLTYKSWFE